ncbi:MAG: glycosyltransferase family 4 protein [Fuerstiella sp.]|nr:glycosyltransferase family 4 protein [Fuerstiella sp.]MCP4787048.1 glycosyltransferase family 4 protein [Fuerstiella sp.]MCP4858886.1 glycosyltransferase family 4 protein [Fuerstiella sp.]
MINRLQQKLLIAVDWFDPAVRAGGPVQSCVNLVNLLHRDASIAVVTGDRDHGDLNGFSSVTANDWQSWRDRASVLYATPRYRRGGAFRDAVARIDPDTIYLNGIFSSAFAILPLLSQRSWRKNQRIVLAPRGMLKPSALKMKSWKKQPLLALLRLARSTRNVVFHATAEEEVDEIRSVFGTDAEIFCVPNIPCLPEKELTEHAKETGQCRLCFVGRIHPVKNLLMLLQQLRLVNGQCRLDVVGPVEDESYFQQCKSAVSMLPSNITVNFLGPLPHKQTRAICSESDATVAPTQGENFGHSIFESFAMGVPALISDQTMWRDLEGKSAGWDIPLSAPGRFAEKVNELCQMNVFQLQKWRRGALDLAHTFFKTHDLPGDYHQMLFGTALPHSAARTSQASDRAAA